MARPPRVSRIETEKSGLIEDTDRQREMDREKSVVKICE